MIEALANPEIVSPAAYVAPLLVKKRKNRRRGSASVPALVVGAWIVLGDGSQCRVSAILPDGRVYCSEIGQ